MTADVRKFVTGSRRTATRAWSQFVTLICVRPTEQSPFFSWWTTPLWNRLSVRTRAQKTHGSRCRFCDSDAIVFA